MTTPKPKARKAACVWVCEYEGRKGVWHPTAYCRASQGAGKLLLDDMRSGSGKTVNLRIRKYQRIDK